MAAGVRMHSALMPHDSWYAESLICGCSYCIIDFCSGTVLGGRILQKNRKIDDQRRTKTALPFCSILILKPPTHFKHRQLQLQRNVGAETQVLLKTQISEKKTQMKHLVIAPRDFFSPLTARRDVEDDPVACCLRAPLLHPIPIHVPLLALSWPCGEPAVGALLSAILEAEKPISLFLVVFWWLAPKRGSLWDQICTKAGPRDAGGLHGQKQGRGWGPSVMEREP